MDNTEAPSGAYCYVIETASTFSTVGTEVPVLKFVESANFGETITFTDISSHTGSDLTLTPTVSAGDTNVFEADALFSAEWYMPYQDGGRKRKGEDSEYGDRWNKKDKITMYASGAETTFNSMSQLTEECNGTGTK